MTISVIYSTFSSQQAAQSMLSSLLSKRLVACGTCISSSSMYEWSGDVVSEDEWVLLCKTTCEKEVVACDVLCELHPYDTPCVLSWRVSANDAYARWVRNQTA